ncbi:cell wall metabolism sensor histidine kinase WalK [Leptotrichia trevisanii]|uniref:sensor histidine kinase n=1 Tax=Leptotrichia trevisanii TaxID=109328 RepID=UPI0026EB6605|nr:HAMP domain-containing sensor histidine kinase [Leptotrichia trevisanii]
MKKKFKISKIRKIKDKIIISNTLSITVAMFIIIMSFFLFFINRDLSLEVKELEPIAKSAVHHFQHYNWNELKQEYDNYYFADKEYMSVMVEENGVSLKFTDDFNDKKIKLDHFVIGKNKLIFTRLVTDRNGRKYYFSRNFTFSDFSEIFYIMIALFLLIIITQFIISSLIAKNILAPVSEIIRQAKEIRNHHIEVKLMKIRDDEIGDLVDIINESFKRKEELIKSQKKFSSDISHELKTPISIVKGYLDILKWGYEDKKILDESLEDMNEEIKKMENIINTLFLTSNMEKLKLNIEKIDVEDFLERIKKDYKIINKNQKIDIIIKNDIFINGDKYLLFEAFRGIIDNGIKYSNNNKIELISETVKLDNGTEQGRIIIRDYGIGISHEEKEKIFNRYYKKNNLAGVGLGLSIIKEIIEVNNGKIELENRKDGLDVILVF